MRSCTRWPAASWSRASNRLNACLTRRPSSCIESWLICQPEKQRLLERLHRSDEDLVGKAVLVVDDDVRNIFALSSVLERRGMKVLTASTGNEAIQTLETTPDVSMVLMDIMMPEMDGYQTMQKIREKPIFRRLADRRADGKGDEG